MSGVFAADKEIEQIYQRNVYDLHDEKTVKRQGHFVFPSRIVYTVSSSGLRKARLVVRGDYQKFEELDQPIVDEEYYENYDVETHVSTHGGDNDFVDKHLVSKKLF